jgi:hypothetical protein
MADYDPKQRRRRVEPAADEPAPVDALLDVVEHVVPTESVGEVPTAGDVTPVVPVGPPSSPPPSSRPDLSVVPGPPAGGPRQLLVLAAAGFGVVVLVWLARRRRRRS